MLTMCVPQISKMAMTIQIHSLINKSSFHISPIFVYISSIFVNTSSIFVYISSIFVYHLHNLLPTFFSNAQMQVRINLSTSTGHESRAKQAKQILKMLKTIVLKVRLMEEKRSSSRSFKVSHPVFLTNPRGKCYRV